MSVTRQKYYYNDSYVSVAVQFNEVTLSNTMITLNNSFCNSDGYFSLGKEGAPLYVPNRLVSTWRFI